MEERSAFDTLTNPGKVCGGWGGGVGEVLVTLLLYSGTISMVLPIPVLSNTLSP